MTKQTLTSQLTRKVYIVDGQRTPFLKAKGKHGPFSASDLAVAAGKDLLARQSVDATDIDEAVIGCMMPSENEANIARVISLRLGCGNDVPAYTVQRNCASGMQAIDSALKDIASGRHNLVLCGGTETMSRAPLIYRRGVAHWFSSLMRAKTPLAKLSLFVKMPLGLMLKPIVALICGLTDPILKIGMGQTAENIAHRFKLTRREIDEFAVRSHQKVTHAQQENHLANISTLYDSRGKTYSQDDGVRAETTVEKLGKLRAMFDRKFGMITAGNSSQVTDGASLLLLASEEAVKKYKLKPMAEILDVNWGALEPEEMGLGPVFAATPLLKRHQLSKDDVDFWEINEAFAAQVIGCVKAWSSEEYCKTRLGLDAALGAIDADKLNVDGGAIALGHPVGASGARIVWQLVNTLRRNKKQLGIASICIGGGQGGAMLIKACK